MKSKESMLPVEILYHIFDYVQDIQTLVSISETSQIFHSTVWQKLQLYKLFHQEAYHFMNHDLAFDTEEWVYINTPKVQKDVQKIMIDVAEFYLTTKKTEFDTFCKKLSDIYFLTHLGSNLMIDRFESDYVDCRKYCCRFNQIIETWKRC